MADAIDFVLDDFFTYRDANNIKNNYSGSTAPSNPATGTRWWDSANSIFKIYNGVAWVEAAPVSDKFPVGSILAWCGGYFTNGSNGGYTGVIGSLEAGWVYCDGSVVNVSASPIWNAAGRYVPDLTDSRFLMGAMAVGSTGGDNSMAHTHPVDPPITTSGAGSDNTGVDSGAVSVSDRVESHTHTLDITSFTSSAASATENRPKFVAVTYIIRVY